MAVIVRREDGEVIAIIHAVMLVLKAGTESLIGGLHTKMSRSLVQDGVHMGQERDRQGQEGVVDGVDLRIRIHSVRGRRRIMHGYMGMVLDKISCIVSRSHGVVGDGGEDIVGGPGGRSILRGVIVVVMRGW